MTCAILAEGIYWQKVYICGQIVPSSTQLCLGYGSIPCLRAKTPLAHQLGGFLHLGHDLFTTVKDSVNECRP